MFFSFFNQSALVRECVNDECVCVCVCVGSRVRGWCTTPGAILSFHATWILLEREVECIQVRWSNEAAGFSSSVSNMNIKHIRIMGGCEYVTPVIPSDLLVSLGLLLLHRWIFSQTCEAFRWLSDCNSKRRQFPTPTHLLADDADSLKANQ